MEDEPGHTPENAGIHPGDQEQIHQNVVWPCVTGSLDNSLQLGSTSSEDSKEKFTYRFIMPLLGSDGLVTAEGEQWVCYHHIMTPAFHNNILKGYVPVVNSHLEGVLKKWTSASKGVPVSIFKDLTEPTLGILLQCAFNSDTSCQQVVINDKP